MVIEQKGIRDWKSSILTADSIYALLSNSRWILDNIKLSIYYLSQK